MQKKVTFDAHEGNLKKLNGGSENIWIHTIKDQEGLLKKSGIILSIEGTFILKKDLKKLEKLKKLEELEQEEIDPGELIYTTGKNVVVKNPHPTIILPLKGCYGKMISGNELHEIIPGVNCGGISKGIWYKIELPGFSTKMSEIINNNNKQYNIEKKTFEKEIDQKVYSIDIYTGQFLGHNNGGENIFHNNTRRGESLELLLTTNPLTKTRKLDSVTIQKPGNEKINEQYDLRFLGIRVEKKQI